MNVSTELYSKIQEWESEGFESPWTDDQCTSAYKKLSKEVKALSAKQEELEERQTEVEKKQEAAKDREELRDNKVTNNMNVIKEMQEKLNKLEAEKSNNAVFRELGERVRKENNLCSTCFLNPQARRHVPESSMTCRPWGSCLDL